VAATLRAVLFDYAGVLGTPPFDGLSQWEHEMGYPDGATLRVIMRGDYLDPASGHGFHAVETGRANLHAFLEQAADGSEELLGGRRFDPAAYLQFLTEPRFGAQWPLVHRARDLRARGYRVAVVTNNIREWEATWTRTIPLEWFDVVVDSCVVGLRKPDPEIYLLACERLGVDPEESVFLDDMEINVSGARAIGMEAIHVRDVASALRELDVLVERRSQPC
jgi:epoxide hydrolase-like predicted phosphatase